MLSHDLKVSLLLAVERSLAFNRSIFDPDNFAFLDNKFGFAFPTLASAMNVYRLVLIRIEEDDYSKVLKELWHFDCILPVSTMSLQYYHAIAYRPRLGSAPASITRESLLNLITVGAEGLPHAACISIL